MKILIVNASDINGGAARAAYRLHRSLLEQSINSQMLVQNKASDDYTVLTNNTKLRKGIFNKLRSILDTIPVKFYKKRSKTLFSASSIPFSNIVNTINKMNPDIVHLHWINGSILRIEDILKINAPIVWTLHDMWAFTGGCHYNENCNGYKHTCGNCKVLASSKENDLSRKIFKRKQKTFSSISNITIIGLSRWLNNASQNSSLLGDKTHINIPNPLNTNIFKACNKIQARELWNLPTDKKLVLFGAVGATSDPRKGFHELVQALAQINRDDLELIVFGTSAPEIPVGLAYKTHYVGCLSDDVSLVTLYSAADVMIVPSLQEAFGQTASESMSCATPVVAFGHTGLLDIVDHKKNGYLASPFDTADLANGIEWVLDNEKYSDLCFNAREKVMRDFDSVVVAKKYINLYRSIINESHLS
jgi:glycosyltransferase involved in cell wall biosynthesis